jgi:hypothetical protein
LGVFNIVLLAALTGPAQPAPSPTPLRTISNVRASPVCTELREDVGQAIHGILVNDQMLDQGRLMLYKVRRDGIAAPLAAGWTGGAGPSSSLDDVQMNNLVGVLAQNLDRIESLLRSANGKDSRLVQARAELERVAARQRMALNILSGNVTSNESADLQARQALVPAGSEAQGPTRISLAEELAAQLSATKQTEIDAALSVKPLIDACR